MYEAMDRTNILRESAKGPSTVEGKGQTNDANAIQSNATTSIEMNDAPFSVAFTTFRKDDPDELSTALDSVINQTVSPSEVVLVKNGPVPQALDTVIDSIREAHPGLLSITELPHNRPRGEARQISIEECRHDLVALMDTDDIAVPNRFRLQLEYLREHPTVDVVGGYAAEFDTDPDEPYAVRSVPLEPETVAKKARFRSPLNQPTVMARRRAILDAGGYRPLHLMEDYDLWMRMLGNDATIANVPEVLVKFRAGSEMYRRRGNLRYARAELNLQCDFYKNNFTTLPVLLLNLCTRVPLRILPNRVREFVYRYARRANQ
jgi:glycosyltransferase involved in cell wall biosynthesis